MNSALSSSIEAAQALVAVLRRHGAKISSKLAFSFKPPPLNMRFMCVSAPNGVDAGEVLAEIPRSLWLDGREEHSHMSRILGENVANAHWQIGLAGRLYKESSVSSSLWEKYVTALPQWDLGHSPVAFSLQQLKALHYEPVCRLILRRQQALKDTLESWKLNDHDGYSHLSEQSLIRMLACITSRAFEIQIGHDYNMSKSNHCKNGAEQINCTRSIYGSGEGGSAHHDISSKNVVKCVLPLMDMANHSFKPSARLGLSSDAQAIRLVATHPMKTGEEITINCKRRERRARIQERVKGNV